MQLAEQRLTAIKQRIHNACRDTGREQSDVTIIGASKTKDAQLIKSFGQAGLKDVGENYLQEAIGKQQALSTLPLNWHFIGSIQSNKTKLIAQHFDWVHGVDRLKIAQRLARQNNKSSPIKVLIQINPDLEDSKAGVALDTAAELADAMAQIDHLQIHGYMMIPMPRDSEAEQRRVFAKAKKTLETSNQRYGLNMRHLSMGMSADLEAAIAEGSTMVRIGTDLFGTRV